jgi:hypothetical protein
LEILPRQARYVNNRTHPEYRDGRRIRHYQNFQADTCHAIDVDAPVDVKGSLLDTDCLSTQTQGGHADFYTFRVRSAGTYQIDLMRDGGIFDPYLYLLRGSQTSGHIEASDNDGGHISRNSKVTPSLSRGNHTVVATNYGEGQIKSGDYLLRIRESDDCPTKRIVEQETVGKWSRTDCESARRSNAYFDFYTLEITGNSSQHVNIELKSSVDAYLFLISGDSAAGSTYLEYDDDDGDVPGDSWIARTLAPGTYTIGATTYYADSIGGYTLEVLGLGLD